MTRLGAYRFPASASTAWALALSTAGPKVFGWLPDETWAYPGHGSDTALGAERPYLEEWRERGW